MICIAKHETEDQMQRRIDLMLREMVVEEALDAMEEEREPGNFTLEEIADFIGVSFKTVARIEAKALTNLRNKMVES
jgi:DNA-directed RNA polymerase specialized sigma subunit|tara:strand:+ start:961 stop:1191 length:231 start_codon:yes stop_codon:yes gene_type:complete